MKLKFDKIRVLRGTAIFFGTVILLRVGISYLHNSQLKEGFSPQTAKPGTPFSHYLEHKPMAELPEFPLVLSDSWLQIEASQPKVIKLRSPLRYYTSPDPFSRPYLELKPGIYLELINWERSVCCYPPGYGFFSYPTYKPGWRIVSPFFKSPSENPVPSWDEAKFYYVRLEDLERVRQDYLYDCMRETQMYPLENFKSRSEYRKALEEKLPLLYVDEELMRQGYYLSPDLLLPLWDGWDTTLCILAVVCVIGSFSQVPQNRLHRTHKTREGGLQ